MVFVIDELLAKQGQGQVLYEAYMARYAPGAEARGMVLKQRLVEPAMWLDQGNNRLIFIWEQAHVGAVWGAKQQARMDTAVDHWWEEEAPTFIESRQRYTTAEADTLEALTNV
ncbi:hypothetical protein NT2_25_00070 [Caenibius tardaugens NBRC 16725]|uniref:NIPSNAP domain-containing protein n=1 Tax=Caenibius tardaugens NBRC 16725 TaxID=1219035 RepID=U2YC77_9SPHN|nr:hypothetical protein [Caenibius tardaugens]AZI35264.1 hypothetical protein EGO55_04225 [Caenibius tardaugens NBRC 16725]GAD51171.1 hypothetical protein NT2_25_00070 [Caenibius tardaugens NBRC 16725]